MKSFCLLLAVGVLGVLFGAGCASNKPGSSSHAYLQITNQSNEAIVRTAIAVYAADGYALASTQPGLLVFQRPASTRDILKYGDWINDGMLMQIKVRLTELSSNITLLQADVYSVQDPRDALFRSETRITLFDRRPYQKMLDDVRDRLEKSANGNLSG